MGEKIINRSEGGQWLTWCCASIWMSDSHLELTIPRFWSFSLLCPPSTCLSVFGLYHFNLILLRRKVCFTFMVIGWSAGVFGRETHIFVNLDIYRDISPVRWVRNVEAQGCRWGQWSLHLQHQQLRGKTDMGVWSWLRNPRRAKWGRSSSWELLEKPISG